MLWHTTTCTTSQKYFVHYMYNPVGMNIDNHKHSGGLTTKKDHNKLYAHGATFPLLDVFFY